MRLPSIFVFLMTPGWRLSWAKTLVISTPASLEARAEELIALKPRLVNVVLGPGWYRTKTHVVPRRARKEWRKIVQLKLEASGLRRSGDMVEVSNRTRRDGKDDVYVQLIARKQDIQTLRETLKSHDLQPRKILGQVDGKDFVFLDSASSTDRPIWTWWLFASVTAFFLAGWAWWTVDQNNSSLRSHLSETTGKIDQVLSAAVEARQERGSVQASRAEIVQLSEALADGATGGEILDTLSFQLPKSTWLTAITIEEGSIHVEALTMDDPLEILRLFEGMRFAKSVELLRPIETNPSDGLSNLAVVITRKKL